MDWNTGHYGIRTRPRPSECDLETGAWTPCSTKVTSNLKWVTWASHASRTHELPERLLPIAQDLAEALEADELIASFSAEGPYVNLRFRPEGARVVLGEARDGALLVRETNRNPCIG